MKTFQVMSVAGGKVVVQRFATAAEQETCHRTLEAAGAFGLRKSLCQVSDEETQAAMACRHNGLPFHFC